MRPDGIVSGQRDEIGVVISVDGDVAPGFERVRDVFGDNFERNGDVGAAVCVYRRGRKVVDLWGGLADAGTGRPWAPDTLQLVYSATKAATSTCAHLLAQRGEPDLDRPAASYWPEFAAEGKADIPVRWLLSHRAGLPVIDNPLPLADLLAWDPIAAALAAQRPAWEPGTAHGYHGRTFGWLVGEVIRRVSGRSVGTFFAEEIAAPAGLDFFIGLPAAERGRVTRMIIDDPPRAEVADIPLDQIPEQFRALAVAFTDPASLMNRAFALSTPDIDFSAPEAQAAEMPSSNGICTAGGLARLYACLIGEVDGVRILDAATLADAIAEQAFGTDRVLLVPSRCASGFMLPTDEVPLGGPASFGHPGRGGSLGFADPDSGTAFGYVVSHIRQDLSDNRAWLLVQAVKDCLV
jgi:CubicO group peptidase (beta-lactamase class C family)